MLDIVSQLGIGVFGMTAIFLVGTKGKYRRWAYIVGLAAQPFWFYTTWQNEQWGIFFLCFLYTISWANGVRNHWFKTDEPMGDMLDFQHPCPKCLEPTSHSMNGIGMFICSICGCDNTPEDST